MVQFYTGASAKLRSGSEDDSNVDAREGAALQVFRQQFGAMPAPDNLLDAFNESLLDRLGRVWCVSALIYEYGCPLRAPTFRSLCMSCCAHFRHLLKQRVELSETYPFESESRIKQDIVDEMVCSLEKLFLQMRLTVRQPAMLGRSLTTDHICYLGSCGECNVQGVKCLRAAVGSWPSCAWDANGRRS